MPPTGAHTSCAGRLWRSEDYGVHGAGISINQLPNEILIIILRFFIRNYFSYHRKLDARLPAPLHVCHKWRQLAISTPTCWSYLKVHINSQSKMKYSCRNVSGRDTRSKAMQDTLSCYFGWAKDCPVDLSINYSQHFGNGVENALIHWISSSMPKLRSYDDDAGDAGLFWTILPAISVDRFSELTELCTTRPAYGLEKFHNVSMPKLRVLQLMFEPKFYRSFIGGLDSHNLRVLHLGIDCPSFVVTVLERFPLLAELAIYNYLSKRSLKFDAAVPRPKCDHLRRIIVVWGCQSMVSICRSLFPKVRDWTIDDLSSRSLSNGQSTEDLVMSYVETLSILCHPYHSYGGSTQPREFWNYFPNIVHLTFGTTRTIKFATRNNIKPGFFKMENTMIYLIKSLGLKSEDSLSSTRCPELRTIEVFDLRLSLDVLGFLLDILQLRSSNTSETSDLGNEDTGCRLTIKGSRYFYSDNDSASAEICNASYSEFKTLVDNLRNMTLSVSPRTCNAVAS